MNSTISLDKKIADYVGQLNTKQKKVILSVAKAFAAEGIEDDKWEDEHFVQEMDRRTAELESGAVKGYTWNEVKAITRQSLADLTNDRENEIDRFYDTIKLDFSGFKFSREEANER